MLSHFVSRELDSLHEKLMDSEGKLDALRKVSSLITSPYFFGYRTGPSCSKLTTLLVNVSLKFQMYLSEICQYFCWQNVRSFCCKSVSHFFSTNNSVFGFKVTQHLSSSPLNKHIKLTML